MRVLIQNYSSPDSTEAMYLNESLASVGVEAMMWEHSSMSAFDAFDSAKPDLFISHYGVLNNDTIKYLSQNKQIQCILNMTGAQQDYIDRLNTLASEAGLNIPFVFTNNFKQINKLHSNKIDLESIAPAADIFVGRINAQIPDFNVQLGVVTNYDVKNRLADVHNEFESYHYLSTNSELTDSLDITAPEANLQSLYSKYKNIVITQDSLFVPQSFFDALLYGNKVYFKAKYESQQKKISKTLNSVFGCEGSFDYKNKHSIKKIKKTLLARHTCLSRAKRIVSKLNHKDLEQKFREQIKEQENDYSSS